MHISIYIIMQIDQNPQESSLVFIKKVIPDFGTEIIPFKNKLCCNYLFLIFAMLYLGLTKLQSANHS